MEGLIKVDTKELISTADRFGTTGGQVKSLTDNMVSLVDSLKGIHEGEAAMAFNAQFHALQDDMDLIYREIQEHVNALNEMARNFEMAENKNRDTASGLPNNPLS